MRGYRYRHYRSWPGYRHSAPPAVVRRMGCAFAMLIVFAAVAAGTVISLLAARVPSPWLTIPAIAIVAMMVLGIAFVRTFRGVALAFREQNRLRRQLMADVAHELRTPLAILQGRIEGLLDGVYERDDERLRELLAETQHLSRLVEDVRTLANAEAGALDLIKEPVDVVELIRETASSFERVRIDAPDHLPPVDADPVRIREVLLNLLSNSAQHAPEGNVTIQVEGRERQVVIRVSDSGPGIPPDELPHVFERFHKGSGSRGTGLGLAISQKLVTAHEGRISVESAAGKGTTVTVTLPCERT